MDKDSYSTIDNPKNTDSLIVKKIIKGNTTFFTFLDSTGKPLSQHYESLLLNNEQRLMFTKLFKKCLKSDEINFPRCGAQYQDAIVFYDSINKPIGFISP